MSGARGLARNTPAFRRANLALFAAGFATFSTLYCVQPLMPLFSRRFGVSPAASSLSLSATTAVLAFTLFLAGLFSGALRRKPVMIASVAASALLSLIAAAAPNWSTLLAIRALEGIALGGVPSLAIAYLSEEIRAEDLGSATGLYIAGTGIGGMSGRVLGGLAADWFGWRAAFALMGALGLIAVWLVMRLLPDSAHFVARRGLALRDHWAPIARHFRHGALPWVFLGGFVFMGTFVSVYNYSAYRLAAPPFSLSQAAVAAVFVVYVFGVGASAVAGRLADRAGRPPVLAVGLALMALGLALMWPDSLVGVITGIMLITVGFFSAHSVASGWVGLLAEHGKGHAAGLYLLGYYLGSSVLGWLGGVFWSAYGWPGVVAMLGALLAGGFVLVTRLFIWQRRTRSVVYRR